jgi:Holliday junction DNA helicase RuvA
MIAYLKGILIAKAPGEAVIDTGGVGYRALISLSTFFRLGAVGEPAELHILTHLTDDSVQLFGFAAREEKDMFLKLIGVSGIGPKLAMNILSGIEPGDLEEAIRKSDLARLSLVPGIGKKTALRITMELQEKLEEKEKLLAVKGSPEKEDLVSALLNMGFRRKEVERAVDQAVAALKADSGFEKLLRDCLRRLAKL